MSSLNEPLVPMDPPEAGARFLFVTDDSFHIEHRGCILTPGIPKAFTPFPSEGASLILRRPDGSTFDAALATELVRLGRKIDTVPILLRDVGKSQIPRKTEVWLRSLPRP